MLLEVSMFFLLFSLLSGAGEPDHQMEIEVIGSQYKDIFIMPPKVKQDGEEVTKYDYAPVVLSKMVMSMKTANYYWNANIEGIYNLNTISAIGGDCDYETKPFQCANENSHHILETDIQITDQKAYIAMTLYDEDSMPVASSTVSKKLRRKIIPRKKRTTTVTPNGVAFGSNTNTVCRDKQSCSIQNRGVVAPRNTTGFSTEELEPTIINFPAVIDSNDVSQAVQLLYSNLK
tara:strand:- start:692 stop:1387 length:696 start_codon:yes stop_codon:yes gene_type:complete